MSTDSVYRDAAFVNKLPEYNKIPANILNFAYSMPPRNSKPIEPDHVTNEQEAKQTKSNTITITTDDRDTTMGADIGTNAMQSQPIAQYSAEISMESRRKINEIKNKLDALNKKYAAEAGLWPLSMLYLFVVLANGCCPL